MTQHRSAVEVTSLPGLGIEATTVIVFGLVMYQFSSPLYLSLGVAALSLAVVGNGLSFIYGRAGMLSMAQAGLWGVGAFAAADVQGHGFVVSCLVATGAGAVGGLVVALPSLRVRGHYFLIITLLLTLGFVIVAGNLGGLTGGVSGKNVSGNVSLTGSGSFGPKGVFLVYLGIFALSLAWIHACRRSRAGQLLLIVRENESLGSALGVNISRLKFMAFAMSGALAGLAGAMEAFFLRFITPDQFGLQAAISVAVVVLIGGSRHPIGPLLGACVVEFVPALLGFSPNVASAMNGGLLILVILVLPGGITGGASQLANTLRMRGIRRTEKIGSV